MIRNPYKYKLTSVLIVPRFGMDGFLLRTSCQAHEQTTAGASRGLLLQLAIPLASAATLFLTMLRGKFGQIGSKLGDGHIVMDAFQQV